MADVEAHPGVSKLPLLIMGAVVIIAVLVTIALVAVREPKTYDPGTPEAAVQQFIQAGFDQDLPAMLEQLTEDSRARCQAAIDDNRFDDYWYDDGLRVELDDMDITGDTASAVVEFHQGDSNNPFDNSSWSYTERFELEQVNGEWLIDRAGWPYQLSDCTHGRR